MTPVRTRARRALATRLAARDDAARLHDARRRRHAVARAPVRRGARRVGAREHVGLGARSRSAWAWCSAWTRSCRRRTAIATRRPRRSRCSAGIVVAWSRCGARRGVWCLTGPGARAARPGPGDRRPGADLQRDPRAERGLLPGVHRAAQLALGPRSGRAGDVDRRWRERAEPALRLGADLRPARLPAARAGRRRDRGREPGHDRAAARSCRARPRRASCTTARGGRWDRRSFELRGLAQIAADRRCPFGVQFSLEGWRVVALDDDVGLDRHRGARGTHRSC